MRTWTPFDKHGRLNVTLATDPWWKRLRARLLRQPIWHHLGYIAPADPWHHFGYLTE